MFQSDILSVLPSDSALRLYVNGVFSSSQNPFITYYDFIKKPFKSIELTRNDFFQLTLRAVNLFHSKGITFGQR